MPINGTYVDAGNLDTVTDNGILTGTLTGWEDQSGNKYGSPIGGRDAYCFGPILNAWGTWGQFIYDQPANLWGHMLDNPTGLNGVMPPVNSRAPDNSTWLQGHLVNAECGGVSHQNSNLTPISHNINALHANYEAVIKRLINRGEMGGAAGPPTRPSERMFNPNQIRNSWFIYRTHRYPGPAGPFPNVPNAIAVSMGIVINGVMKNQAEVIHQLTGVMLGPRWFRDHYYGAAGMRDRDRIVEMIGGVRLGYP